MTTKPKKLKTAQQIGIDDLLAELESARVLAGMKGNASAMVSATMAKAKLCGLDRPAIATNDAVQQISDLIDELSNDATG